MENNEKEVLFSVSHLKKYFQVGNHATLKAVDDVSFEIYKGETLGMVGESGCGKTTCGRTCIGLYDKTDGQVLYKGTDVHALNGKERFAFKKQVQMVFQDPLAFFFITFFCRQKCLKTEPSGWKPGHGKGGDTGCRSWK